MKIKFYLLILLFAVFSGSTSFSQMDILSGPAGSSYYQFVEDMKGIPGQGSGQLLNNHETAGAAKNFEQLVDPKTTYKLALIQSDLLYLMKALDSRDNTTYTDGVKVIYPLANEEIHVVTRKNSGLKHLKDLNEDIVVGIGNKNQGTYATANIIKDRSEVLWTSKNVHFDEAFRDLLLEKIDAFFMVGTAPIKKLDLNPQAMTVGLALIPLEDFNNWAKPYVPVTITKDDYRWLDEDIPTYGVTTLLIVNENKLDDGDREKIASLMKSIEANLGTLQENGHPKWQEVDLTGWNSVDWPTYK